MVSGKRESCDERGKREEKGLCDGEGEKGRGRRVRERYRALSPFADGEEAAASAVRQGKRPSRGRCGEGDEVSPLDLGHGCEFEDAVPIWFNRTRDPN
ncbi:hypothetical protein BHE74_00055762 [Ensete ventricosum]|nr:hypothetical protein GW17_00058548 [Ensete ventricosum]RWW38948.1 hypothetical protein BHE74_00055762 [Ensete ventricosum]